MHAISSGCLMVLVKRYFLQIVTMSLSPMVSLWFLFAKTYIFQLLMVPFMLVTALSCNEHNIVDLVQHICVILLRVNMIFCSIVLDSTAISPYK